MQKLIYEARKKDRGEQDPGTLIYMRNWAYSVMYGGSPEIAEPIFRKCYELSKSAKDLGPNHPDTIRTYGALAMCLGRLGKGDEETKMRKEEFEKMSNKLGR